MVSATVIAIVIGVPTGIIRSSFYIRMTPVLWWNYPVWVVSAVLGGLVVATYVREPHRRERAKMATSGGFLSFLAVGCPVCNKVVVAAIGVSGALKFFAPAQPILGVISLSLMTLALRKRLLGQMACPVQLSPP